VVSIRIISGKYKGMKLYVPAGFDIRPTQDRVKESIFNVIRAGIEGSKVLDLFSGSGSLGIESISRGAGLVYFIDNSVKSIRLIRSNIRILKGVEADYRIIKKDAETFIKSFRGVIFDIIFIDPPYKIDTETMRGIFGSLKEKIIIGNETVIIYEYFLKRYVADEISGFKIIKNSNFGDKIVSYLKM